MDKIQIAVVLIVLVVLISISLTSYSHDEPITDQIFRLDVIGSEQAEWIPEGYTENWRCVSDSDRETYVWTDVASALEVYNLSSPNPRYRDWNIVQISIYCSLAGIGADAKVGLYKPGEPMDIRHISLSSPEFNYYQESWLESPWRSFWSWGELDHLRIVLLGDDTEVSCSDIHVEVQTDWNNEIRRI